MVCAPVLRDNRPYRGTNHAVSLTCTMMSIIDPARYRVSRAKDWVSVDCGTKIFLQLPCCYCYPNLMK